MKFISVFGLFVSLAWAESACNHESKPLDSRCTGCPPKFNGKVCASTTRYNDLTKGACGCGTEPNPKTFWTKNIIPCIIHKFFFCSLTFDTHCVLLC